MSEDLSIEHKLAQAMIELRKGREPISSLLLRKDLLNREIKKLEEELTFVQEENKFLDGFKKTAELVMRKNGDINDNDVKYLLKEINCEKKLEEAATQACSRSLTFSSRSKERLINNLLIKENLLKAKLNSVKAETNYTGPDYILVKRSEYLDLLSKAETVPKLYKPFDSRDSLQTSNSDLSVSSNNFSPVSSNSQLTECTSNGSDRSYVKMEVNNENNGFSSFPEESDEEGARLLLSMKQNCWSCKCGEYFNNITDWSEHKKICNPTVEKCKYIVTQISFLLKNTLNNRNTANNFVLADLVTQVISCTRI